MLNFFGKRKKVRSLLAVSDGTLKELKNVDDPIFSRGLMGVGYGLDPIINSVFSPVSGTVTMVADTLHGIGIRTEDGLDVLIHMGIDTVELKGAPFTVNVRVGDVVEARTLLATMDINEIKKSGKASTIMVVITNSKELGITVSLTSGSVTRGTPSASILLE